MRLFWRPPRIFFGWWIVCATFLIYLYTIGAVYYGFTAIFEPVAEEFHWSYAQISLAASLRGLEVSLLAPLTGILVDRWGPRRLIFAGILLVIMGLLLLSQVTSLGIYYASFILISIGLSFCGTTVLMAAISNWFRKYVGMAIGIVSCGVGFAGLMVPLIVKLIDLYEWRMTVTILAIGLLVLILPLSLLFRHKPEQYGYLPDGKTEKEVKQDEIIRMQQADEISIGVRPALKTRTFWHLAVTSMCHVLTISPVVAHLMPYLSSVGLARSVSGLIATAVPLTSIAGRIGLGWLGDRFSKKWITTGALAVTGLGTLCFAYVTTMNMWLLVPFCIFFGIGWGGSATLRPALVREYFGRTNFGTIFGFIMGIAMIGSFAGPPIAGWVFDTWGSYQGIWLVNVVIGLLAAIVMAATPPVNKNINHSTR